MINELDLPPEADRLCPFRPCWRKHEGPVCFTHIIDGCPAWRGNRDDKAKLDEAVATAREYLDKNNRHFRVAGFKILELVQVHPRLSR